MDEKERRRNRWDRKQSYKTRDKDKSFKPRKWPESNEEQTEQELEDYHSQADGQYDSEDDYDR